MMRMQCAVSGCPNLCTHKNTVCMHHATVGTLTAPVENDQGTDDTEPYVPNSNPKIYQPDGECPCTCDGIAEHLAGCRLNDQKAFTEDGCGEGCGDEPQTDPESDWQVYPLDVIRKVVKEAISAFYNLHPDIFAEPKEITLERGKCVHILCHECAHITSVISVDGRDCQEVDENTEEEQSLEFLNCWYTHCASNDPCAAPEGAYEPGKWRKDEGTPCAIRFDKPTPEDRDVKAVVSCIDPCAGSCDKPLPARVCQEAFSTIVDNALFRLYMIDHKDGYDRERGMAHWAAFEMAMLNKFRVDYALLRADYLKTMRKSE